MKVLNGSQGKDEGCYVSAIPAGRPRVSGHYYPGNMRSNSSVLPSRTRWREAQPPTTDYVNRQIRRCEEDAGDSSLSSHDRQQARSKRVEWIEILTYSSFGIPANAFAVSVSKDGRIGEILERQAQRSIARSGDNRIGKTIVKRTPTTSRV